MSKFGSFGRRDDGSLQHFHSQLVYNYHRHGPQASNTAWILVLSHPWLCPISFEAPFAPKL